jgi:hypothetical protein
MPSSGEDKMFNDRFWDIADAFLLDDINKDEFVRRMADLLGDWHDAHTHARMLKPQDCDK